MDKNEVLKIAATAQIFVRQDAVEELTDEISRLVRFADSVCGFEGSDIPPPELITAVNVLRDDVVKESSPVSDILSHVGGSEGYFVVPKRG